MNNLNDDIKRFLPYPLTATDTSKIRIIAEATPEDVIGVKRYLTKYSIGDIVLHSVYGEGKIEGVENEEYIIEFDSGTKRAVPIDVELALVRKGE